MQNGHFHKAVRTYTKALELDAGNAILYSNRSAAHFNIRQFSESLEDAESAILCDASWWKAYKRKGLALIHMQRYEEAISSLQEGLTIVGKNAEMEKNLEFAKACQEQAQNLYILPESHMMQRLESVPVFIVTDSSGQPFFVTYDDGQQVCTFYFDRQDAIATLDWIKTENKELGDTARVIHITLHQAFNLAQETQKQYYEETTRAAAEEDRIAAAEAETKAKDAKRAAKQLKQKPSIRILNDVVMTDIKEEPVETVTETKVEIEEIIEMKTEIENVVPATAETDKPRVSTDDWEEAEVDATVEEHDKDDEQDEEDKKKDEAVAKVAAAAAEKEKKEEGEVKKEVDDGDDKDNEEDAIIDENAPLSFQFRPELRQVQVAVELLNKNPNPPVRPILRDPPSVRKAKAEAKAKLDAVVEAERTKEVTIVAESEMTDEKEGAEKEEQKKVEVKTEEKQENIIDEIEGKEEAKEDEVMMTDTEEKKETDVVEDCSEKIDIITVNEKIDVVTDSSEKVDEKVNEEKKDAMEGNTNEEIIVEINATETEQKKEVEGEDSTVEKIIEEESIDMSTRIGTEEEEVELTVDNFNGIPIFQAKGLTLLQKNKQLIPLFFSKWDLEDAWLQLKNTNTIGVPGECEVEVGTLEDVLRRMSESKTDEFESVFFVPSRESMRAINVKFPLDDLSTPTSSTNTNTTVKRSVGSNGIKGKNGLTRAKQIAERGGSREEIRAAIVEDLRKYKERQKMQEVVSQIEHARRLSGVGGMGNVGFSSTIAAAAGAVTGTSATSASAGTSDVANNTESSSVGSRTEDATTTTAAGASTAAMAPKEGIKA